MLALHHHQRHAFARHLDRVRHTYATLAYRDGVQLEVIGALLTYLMLWVRHESPWKPATRNQRLWAVRLLLEEQREDGLAGLSAGAVIHAAELPRVDWRLPRTLPGEVFAQRIDPRTW